MIYFDSKVRFLLILGSEVLNAEDRMLSESLPPNEKALVGLRQASSKDGGNCSARRYYDEPGF